MSTRRSLVRRRVAGTSGTGSDSIASDSSLEDRPLVSAVDVDIGAGDERGALRGEERDRVGDVVGRAPAAERDLGAPLRLLLLEAAAEIDLVVELQPIG